jgi:hypothetical protein
MVIEYLVHLLNQFPRLKELGNKIIGSKMKRHLGMKLYLAKTANRHL